MPISQHGSNLLRKGARCAGASLIITHCEQISGSLPTSEVPLDRTTDIMVSQEDFPGLSLNNSYLNSPTYPGITNVSEHELEHDRFLGSGDRDSLAEQMYAQSLQT